jgi:hypothetical protein
MMVVAGRQQRRQENGPGRVWMRGRVGLCTWPGAAGAAAASRQGPCGVQTSPGCHGVNAWARACGTRTRQNIAADAPVGPAHLPVPPPPKWPCKNSASRCESPPTRSRPAPCQRSACDSPWPRTARRAAPWLASSPGSSARRLASGHYVLRGSFLSARGAESSAAGGSEVSTDRDRNRRLSTPGVIACARRHIACPLKS